MAPQKQRGRNRSIRHPVGNSQRRWAKKKPAVDREAEDRPPASVRRGEGPRRVRKTGPLRIGGLAAPEGLVGLEVDVAAAQAEVMQAARVEAGKLLALPGAACM